MGIHIFQKGFNYSQDGPGNRLVYHLQGCNMRCRWCSNPEGLSMQGIKAKEYKVEELAAEIENSKKMFFDGGGITLTGGEVTCQFQEVEHLLQKISLLGISTCIETNATHPQLEKLLPYVQYLIMDFKHYDKERHKEYTGVSNTAVVENLEKICRLKKPVLIRTPLIHGFNDDKKDIEGFLKVYEPLNLEEASFEFLSYHEYGKDKWKETGLAYQMENAHITQETKEYFEQKMEHAGYRVLHT